jgi:hypothetical protein
MRIVEKPAGSLPCVCGGMSVPALRYEARQTLSVHCCWDCGREHPPLYERATSPDLDCLWCGASFTPIDHRQRYCQIDCARRGAVVREERRRHAAQIGRRPS